MKKVIIITISWLLVVCWMLLIFFLSDMNGEESTNKSVKTIETTIKKTVETTNDLGITNKNLDSKKVQEVAKKANFPVRKLLHLGEYLILTLLLMNALYRSGVKKNKTFIFSLLISILYACSDEFHQSFTSRTASIKDILIDSLGSIIAVIIVALIIKIKNRKNIRSN